LGQILHIDDARILKFTPKVVALTGALAHAGENRKTATLDGDIVDQLLDQHRLADACAAEQPGLAALGIGLEQVDDLDAGLEHLGPGLQILEGRGIAMDSPLLFRLQRSQVINRLADEIEQTAQRRLAHRHLDRRAGVHYLLAALQSVRRIHGDAAGGVLAQMLRHLQHQKGSILAGILQGGVDSRQLAALEKNINDRTDDLCYTTNV